MNMNGKSLNRACNLFLSSQISLNISSDNYNIFIYKKTCCCIDLPLLMSSTPSLSFLSPNPYMPLLH